MPTSSLSALITLTDDAFERHPLLSILANLRDLREEDWTAVPPGGGRSIADILEHVGWSKWMYENYAFGDAAMRGDQPPLIPTNGARSRPREELVAWMTEGHRRWVESLKALTDDSELDVERMTNWGQPLPTRALIHIVIGHDFYHAGEINHIRALLQGTDRWPYD